MKTSNLVAGMLGLFSLGLFGYAFTYKAPEPEKRNLVCFDMTRNLRLRLVENDIRFDSNIIRFTNDKGDYAIYPPEGWLCSIIKVSK